MTQVDIAEYYYQKIKEIASDHNLSIRDTTLILIGCGLENLEIRDLGVWLMEVKASS